jgi:hypothetical protein
MGLEEKRKIKEYQDTIIPERTTELAEIVGGTIPYEIEWDTFADDAEALRFLDNLSFHRINMAMRTICTDDLGKEAVRDAIKSIKLKNVQTKDEMSLAVGDGALSMALNYAKGTDGYFSDGEIRTALMAKL